MHEVYLVYICLTDLFFNVNYHPRIMAKRFLCPRVRRIASNLIALRNKNGFTQQAVADILNIERKTYAAMENGQTDIRLSVLIQLADIYKTTLEEVCYVEENKTVASLHGRVYNFLESLLKETPYR